MDVHGSVSGFIQEFGDRYRGSVEGVPRSRLRRQADDQMRSNASAALKGRRRRVENMVAICVMAAAFILRRPMASSSNS